MNGTNAPDPARMPRHPGARRIAAGGFTYLGVMFLIALLSLTATAATSLWRVDQKRDNETQLLFVGRQFRSAIEHFNAQDKVRKFPESLEIMLSDTRSLTTRRELRTIYQDPFTHQTRWGVLLDKNNGIVGVYSLASGHPQKTDGFLPGEPFGDAHSYRDWTFVASGARALVARAAIEDTGSKGFQEDPLYSHVRSGTASPGQLPRTDASDPGAAEPAPAATESGSAARGATSGGRRPRS